MAYSADLVKVTVQIPMKSGILKDAVVNDFHYTSPPTPSPTDFDNMAGHLLSFYQDTHVGAANTVAHYLGDEISQATDAVTVRFYHVPTGGGHIGSPIAVRMFTWSAVGSGTLPEECAVVLGFRTAYGTDVEFGPGTRPRSRDRNRVFLGPLSTAAKTQDATTKRNFVATAMITDVMVAAIDSLYTGPFGDSWLWREVSKVGLVDNAVEFVDMDNALDTQRRRGPAPTAKVEAPVV